MAPGIILLALVGVWLLLQATAGDLAGRLLSWSDRVPGDGGARFWGAVADQARGSDGPGRAVGTATGGATNRTGDGVPLVTWRGATLASHVMPSYRAMITAAATDGVSLSPVSTYRSRAAQIDLRRQHCGTSDYAINRMPAGECTPPTARPGTSRHQGGEAVDFANMSSRATPGFAWLDANAARFGFFNLPSEPWHWSTDGH